VCWAQDAQGDYLTCGDIRPVLVLAAVGDFQASRFDFTRIWNYAHSTKLLLISHGLAAAIPFQSVVWMLVGRLVFSTIHAHTCLAQLH
jgi:hypothetical protein